MGLKPSSYLEFDPTDLIVQQTLFAMAHFSDRGQHCSHPYCRQRDFLPFECDLCKAILCREHLRYEDHDCPHQARKDARVMLCPAATSLCASIQMRTQTS